MKQNTARILVIDDQADFRLWLTDVLTEAGYEVSSASNGKDALAKLQHWPANLVITDMLMPEMDGVQIILALRRQHPNVNIVAVSGGGHVHPAKYLKVAETLGAGKTMLKPFSHSEVLDVVRSLIEDKKPDAR